MKRTLRAWVLGKHFRLAPSMALFGLVWTLACSSGPPPLTGNALTYQKAKDSFKKGNFGESADYAEELSHASPPSEFTDRAQVLDVVILVGLVSGYQNLTDTYQKGADKTPNAHLKGEYHRLRNDNLQFWTKRSLGLGEAALKLMRSGGVPKDLTLEVFYPSVEPPVVVAQFERVAKGVQISTDDEEAAALDAQAKSLGDGLGQLFGGDRAKARTALEGGSAKLNNVDFALFLGHGLLESATAFDRKHMHEPTKFTALHDAAEKAAASAEASLKDSPNPDQAKELKKLQDDLKAALKEKA